MVVVVADIDDRIVMDESSGSLTKDDDRDGAEEFSFLASLLIIVPLAPDDFVAVIASLSRSSI